MSIITRLTPMLAKIEPVTGTDSVPVVGVDGKFIEEFSFSDEALRMTARPAMKPTMGQVQSIFGDKLRAVTFNAELKGNGALGVAPEIGPLLRSCGMLETIVPATSVAYTPISTGHESITIYAFTDGQRYILTGCRGTFTLTLTAGMPGKLAFTFTGHSVDPTDVALPPTVTYNSQLPPPYLNAAAAIGGDTPSAFSELTLDMQNKITMQPDATAVDGFGEIQIVDRDIIGTMNPEIQLKALKDNWAEFRNGTNVIVTSGLWGTAAGNQMSVIVNQAHYRELGNSDNDGIRHHNIGFGFHESAGDDEVAINFV